MENTTFRRIEFDSLGPDSNLEPLTLNFASCLANCTGHGDAVWAASIAAAYRAVEIVSKGLNSSTPGSDKIRTLKSLELGAGIGIPSLVLAQAFQNNSNTGLSVHISDFPSYGNLKQLILSAYFNNSSICVFPHKWGDNDQEVVLGGKCDLLIVADCIYNPATHSDLLTSISRTLSKPRGVALITFSLHGNAKTEDVLGFFEKQRLEGEFGLKIESGNNDLNYLDCKFSGGGRDWSGEMRKLGLFRENMGDRNRVYTVELGGYSRYSTE